MNPGIVNADLVLSVKANQRERNVEPSEPATPTIQTTASFLGTNVPTESTSRKKQFAEAVGLTFLTCTGAQQRHSFLFVTVTGVPSRDCGTVAIYPQMRLLRV
jgi:hypothetical protein